jgi:hypothetical protein
MMITIFLIVALSRQQKLYVGNLKNVFQKCIREGNVFEKPWRRVAFPKCFFLLKKGFWIGGLPLSNGAKSIFPENNTKSEELTHIQPPHATTLP